MESWREKTERVQREKREKEISRFPANRGASTATVGLDLCFSFFVFVFVSLLDLVCMFLRGRDRFSPFSLDFGRWRLIQLHRRRLLSPRVEALLALRRRHPWLLSAKAVVVGSLALRESV